MCPQCKEFQSLFCLSLDQFAYAAVCLLAQIVVAIEAIRELCKEVDPACSIEVPEPCQAHIEVGLRWSSFLHMLCLL